MAALSIEERMTVLEAEVARLKKLLPPGETNRVVPWWEKRFGAFKDDPLYDEAMRLATEYRQSQPTPLDEDAPA